jgi:hypothetical protein
MKNVCATGPGSATQRGAQVFADGAADAAVAHLDDLLVGVADQDVAVDVFFTELVFHYRDFLSVRLGQHPLEQRGFARTQEAGQDGGGNERHGGVQKNEVAQFNGAR